MLLKIQGSRYSRYDPEIATADLIDEGGLFLSWKSVFYKYWQVQ